MTCMAIARRVIILMIEDEAAFRRIYRDVLESVDYEVLEAADGEVGWQLAQERRPDLIMLDLVLPKLHGFEVLKRLRADKDTTSIPVIICSVLGEPTDIQKGMELGANAYTVKGLCSPRDLLNKIRSLLE